MNTTSIIGDRYSVKFTSGETSYSGAQRFETISEVLDYAQETGLAAGIEAIITDHAGGRPTLAVRIVP